MNKKDTNQLLDAFLDQLATRSGERQGSKQFGGFGVGYKNDPPLTPVGPYHHGVGGLFNRRELDTRLVSAVMAPLAGVANAIPVFNGSQDSGGVMGGADAGFDSFITGVTQGALDLFANQPTADCADGPVGGLKKVCTIVNPFGRYRASTREVSMIRAGRYADRCDPLVLEMLNEPVLRGLFSAPSNTPTLANAVNNEVAQRIWEGVLSFGRMFTPRTFIGSPANNSGERRDIVGLEMHVNAGNKIDALSSAVCTAANADLKDFGFDLVGGGGRDIVEYVEMLMHFIEWNAVKMGLTPYDGFLAMRPELWQVLSEVWPVRQYQASLNQMANFNNGRLVVDATQAQAQRDQFRQNLVLPVNGRNWDVVLDDTIPEDDVTTNANLLAGQYASDIYFIPTQVIGGVPATFWEFFDHGNNQANTIQQMAGNLATFTSDGGMLRWYVDFSKGCLKLNWDFLPRLRLRTPMISGRIQNVAYAPLQHLRAWDPADTNYFADGGVSEGGTEQYYASWSTATPTGL